MMKFKSDAQRKAMFSKISGYHGARFGTEDPLRQGFHIGTKKAALERLKWHSGGNGPRYIKDSELIEYEGDFDRPYSKDDKILDETEEFTDFFFLDRAPKAREDLIKKGFDYIPYINKVEDPGSVSYMILDLSKLKEVGRHKVTQEEIDSANLYSEDPEQKTFEGDIEFADNPDIYSKIDDMGLHLTSKDKDIMVRLMKEWKKKFSDDRPSEDTWNINDVDWVKVYDDIGTKGLDEVEDTLILSGSNQQVRYKIPSFYLTEHAKGEANELKKKRYGIESMGKYKSTELTDFKMGKPKKKNNVVEKLAVINGDVYRPLTMFSKNSYGDN